MATKHKRATMTARQLAEDYLAHQITWDVTRTSTRHHLNQLLALFGGWQARFERLRAERDRRLTATDYLLMQDYPLDNTHKEAVRIYRQALRDLPSQEGAPWDGGGESTPWPDLPAGI